MSTRTKRASKKTKSHSPSRSILQFSDDEEDKNAAEDVLSTRPGGRAGGGRRRIARTKSYDDQHQEDSEEEEQQPRRGRSRAQPLASSLPPQQAYGGAASYLPTAYGGGGAAGGAPGLGDSTRERSVDRIRARSNDHRRDISKERGGGRRDRSLSQSRNSNKTETQRANERAARRRRDRRESLEASLGMMSMDDSVASMDLSVASESAPSALLINGMDSSLSQIEHVDRRPGRAKNLRRTKSRDSTSTDYTAERRQQKRTTPKASKTWDGRVDDILNKRRARKTAGN